ncbi:TPM domain-containing protein [Mucilaginibacter daejeonensis]|uniref:TPM domain-containing protein n=1 Tax=Mucilaginibacter daejeonensis TaxID=398049 RepID=UPI001D17C67E|nr:TPM domain-containing protein [Mucilaginibacter daejeonensis]UEG55043.1 TPM domain-containing protein [Mucilaginibacter daejeonensis]
MQLFGYVLRMAMLLSLTLNLEFSYAQQKYKVDDIPNPRELHQGSVSDPDGILTSSETVSLNSIIDTMEAKTGVQTAIVVIHDLPENDDEFDAAVELFRKWGIGKKYADNGLLLMVVIDRHRYRFVTGYGVEGLLPDHDLQLIGENDLVPAFKQKEYGQGIIAAMETVAAYLQQPANHKELQALLHKKGVSNFDLPTFLILSAITSLVFILMIGYIVKKSPAVPKNKTKNSNSYQMWSAGMGIALFLIVLVVLIVSGFTKFAMWDGSSTMSGVIIVGCLFAVITLLFYIGSLGVVRKAHFDDLNFYNAKQRYIKATWWAAIFSPLIIVVLIIESLKRKKYTERFTPLLDENGNTLQRVDRDQNIDGTPYLSEGQRKEEELGVYQYDIWLAPDPSGETKIIQQKADNYGKYTVCPQCNFKTMKKPELKTIVSPTRSRQGQGKKIAVCQNCKHEEVITTVVIPMLTSNSSSSSSSSSSGSSSSSSYGGGSTGGGGAGGSW